MIWKRTLIAALAAAFVGSAAPAAVLWVFEETGGDVVGTYSGSIDLTGLTLDRSGNTFGSIVPFESLVLGAAVAGPGSTASQADVYHGAIAGSGPIGTGGLSNPSSFTGDVFGIQPGFGEVVVNANYDSGSAIAGSIAFASTTFAGLGRTPGTYEFSLPSDTVAIRVGPETHAVPLPAAALLLLTGLASIRLAGRRPSR